VDKINADSKGNRHQVARKKIGFQIVNGSKCYSMNGPRRDEKFEEWERCQKRMLFVTDSIQLVQ
jgi:hypothetical protein